MFGSFRKFGKLGSSPGSKSAAVMPSGAIGIWYADQYQSSPSRYIPNAVNPVAPIGYFHGIRRTLSVVNRTLWDASDCTVVENAAVGPDGSTQDAATISGTGTSWAFGKASIVLPAGTYTVVPVVKRNAGSDQEFVSRVSSQISAKRVATASWQRFPFTFTTGGGSVNVYALWSASAGTPAGATDANLQVHEVNLYSGAADLGSDALVGNMVLGFSGGSTLPSVSGNLVDLSAGSDSFATIQFDEAKVFQNAMTYIVVAQQVTNTNSYPSLLHAFNSGGDFNELNAWMAYNSETLEWRYKGNQAYVQREPSLLFNGKGLHGFTFRYDGSSMDTFVDDVIFSKKAASSLGTVTTKDFYVGLWGGARSNHKLFAAALYNRALSDAEVRAAYAALKLRAESLALTVTPDRKSVV